MAGAWDVFIIQIKPDRSGYDFSTLLGSAAGDEGLALSLDNSGGIYVISSHEASFQNSVVGAVNAGYFLSVLDRPFLDPDQERGVEQKKCPCDAQPRRGRPVNTRTGNYETQSTDLRVETPGVPLEWTRSYASRAITDTLNVLGPGWQHPYGQRLILPSTAGGDVIVYSGVNNRLRFRDTGMGVFRQ